MEFLILLSLFHVLLQAFADVCPSTDWISHDMQCYLFRKRSVDWYDAKDFCATQHAHLVRNNNADIDKFLKTKMIEQAWADVCPNQTWIPYKMKCYLFMKEKVIWDKARNFCGTQHAHLVRNDNAGIDAFLRAKMIEGGIAAIWTGANDIDTEGVFVWEDSGDPVIYTDWETNQPGNFNNQDCVRFSANKGWNDIWCSGTYTYMYACQTNQTGGNDQVSATASETTVTVDTTSSDDVVDTTKSVDVEHTTNSDDVEHITSSADVEHTTSSDDVEHTTRTNDTGNTSYSDDVVHTTTSVDVEHTTGSGFDGPTGSTVPGDVHLSTDVPPRRLCDCCSINNSTQLTSEQKQRIITQLKEELSVLKANTSASRRKLISVMDYRPSCVAMGSLGCCILVFVIGFIVVPDMINLGRFLYKKQPRQIMQVG